MQRRFLRKRGAAGKALLGASGLNPLRHGLRRATSPERGRFCSTYRKVPKSSPFGGAVAQRLRGYKWRSEKSVKAIAPTGAALAFLCFDFFFRIVKGVQPLARCGVGGVQR